MEEYVPTVSMHYHAVYTELHIPAPPSELRELNILDNASPTTHFPGRVIFSAISSSLEYRATWSCDSWLGCSLRHTATRIIHVKIILYYNDN